jgi:putative isomerase
MCYRGLKKYGFDKEAASLAEATTLLLGKDIEACGEMHEYYHPDTGEGVHNQGFQSWNLLVNNMLADLEGRRSITEF